MTRFYLKSPFESCFHNLYFTSATSSLVNGSSAFNAAWTLVRCWVVSDCLVLSRVFIYICSFSLECAKGLHLYDGRCYQRCPGGSYAGEIIMQANSRRRNLTYEEAGDSSVAKRQGDVTRPSAIEAFDMESNYSKTPLVCFPCHYTCATCVGPNSSQCSSCLNDAQLFNLTDVEPKSYCYPNTILPQINNANWHYKMNLILIIALLIISIISIYVFVVCGLKRMGVYCCGNNYDSNIKIAYNKLAVDDKYQSAIEIEDEIHKALNNTSESESEEDDLKS